MTVEGMKVLNEGLKLIGLASTVTVAIYKGLTWAGRESARMDRRRGTKKWMSKMETLALATTAYVPMAISSAVVGEKTTACLLAFGFSLMGMLYAVTVFMWPSRWS